MNKVLLYLEPGSLILDIIKPPVLVILCLFCIAKVDHIIKNIPTRIDLLSP